MPIDSFVKQRIAMLRTLLIMLILFLHIGSGPSAGSVSFANIPDLLVFFLQDALGRLAVPTLTLISGFLLFNSKLDLHPLKLYKNKTRTLLVPFLFFNVVYFAVQYVIEYYSGWAPLYALVDAPPEKLLNYLIGYSTSPLNPSLHFLRDLLVLVLLTPLFSFFLRHHCLLGLFLVTGIFMSNSDRHLINRDTMPVLFYLGGMISVKQLDVKKYDRFAPHCILVLFIVCCGTIYFSDTSHVYIYLLAPFTIWPASVLLLDTRFGHWALGHSKYSFFIFLAHYPLIRLLDLLRHKLTPGMGDKIGRAHV